MKKLLVVLLSLAMLLCCSGFAEGETYEVAVLIGDRTATYASWLAQSFEEIVAQYPQIQLTVMDCSNDIGAQISNLENCVSKGFDMVIVQPIDVAATSDTINMVIDAGIPVCTVNGSNEGCERASCVDCYLVQQGSIPAEQAGWNSSPRTPMSWSCWARPATSTPTAAAKAGRRPSLTPVRT